MFRQIWRKLPLDNRQIWLHHKVGGEKPATIMSIISKQSNLLLGGGASLTPGREKKTRSRSYARGRGCGGDNR
jgi:hypothetical protein